MSRPLRIEYPGAWHHVMNRGAGKRAIFNTDAQRRYFLSLLADTYQRFHAEWHAYCLMDNHYHLMIRTPEGNLQRIMRHVNGLYTQYFNRNEQLDGPLFRGRYKAILVDSDAYWLELSRYIHQNPLRATRVRKLSNFRWSSYPAYIGDKPTPDWLTTDYILDPVGRGNARLRYAAYVAKKTDKALEAYYAQAKREPILGDDAFKDSVMKGQSPNIDQPELSSMAIQPSLKKIVESVCKHFDIDRKDIWQSRRGKAVVSPARSATMYLCQYTADMRLAEIAEHFGLASYASAGASIRLFKSRLEKDKNLSRTINYIILDLTPLSTVGRLTI